MAAACSSWHSIYIPKIFPPPAILISQWIISFGSCRVTTKYSTSRLLIVGRTTSLASKNASRFCALDGNYPLPFCDTHAGVNMPRRQRRFFRASVAVIARTTLQASKNACRFCALDGTTHSHFVILMQAWICHGGTEDFFRASVAIIDMNLPLRGA